MPLFQSKLVTTPGILADMETSGWSPSTDVEEAKEAVRSGKARVVILLEDNTPEVSGVFSAGADLEPEVVQCTTEGYWPDWYSFLVK